MQKHLEERKADAHNEERDPVPSKFLCFAKTNQWYMSLRLPSILGSLSGRLKMMSLSSVEATTAKQILVNCKDEEIVPTRGKRKPLSKDVRNHPKKMFKSSYEERFGETSYFLDAGFRRVVPYVYAFETHAKGRWYERKLLDIFKTEFRLETPEFYAKAIQMGLIKVNGQKTTADYVVKSNDFLHSKVHRHEPPVTSDPIEIVENTDEFVVVNKPPSIPVHPCGKYRHNTIVFLLAKEHNLTRLHTIHRLDRLTSGLLMFAKTKAVSQRVDAYVRERKLKKTYVCKVVGEFPSHSVECNEPIFIVSHKIGICRVSPDGKPCKTNFQRISYDGETSIVKCFPETGRMHQIRVHLQYLGHPIQNDPLYNNTVWGAGRGHGGCKDLSDEELLTRLVDQHDEEKTTKINEMRKEAAAEINDKQDSLRNIEGRGSTSPQQDIAVHGNEAQPHKKLESIDDTLDDGQTSSKSQRMDRNCDDGGIAEDRDCSSQIKVSSSLSESTVSSPRVTKETSEYSLCDTEHINATKSDTMTEGENSLTSEKCSELTRMDGTLSGIGVLEVNEQKLMELADDGTEGAVNEIAKMLCRECVTPLPDPKPDEMMIYLHALTYQKFQNIKNMDIVMFHDNADDCAVKLKKREWNWSSELLNVFMKYCSLRTDVKLA
ncbi:uncharacterized protein [Apostichopus japonicus]|uniref:uncharacterized protein isoform X3 n=1 Tax=Stichopus japonicus TaxID=307972 RepID=UPI003AB7AF02